MYGNWTAGGKQSIPQNMVDLVATYLIASCAGSAWAAAPHNSLSPRLVSSKKLPDVLPSRKQDDARPLTISPNQHLQPTLALQE